MKHGVYVPNFGAFGEPRALVDLAVAAERAGRDGFFVWDHVARPGHPPVADPWIALAAIAALTERIRIGALVTPLARRRPWKVARETASLDRLANGRLVFGAGLGSAGGAEVEWAAFGEERDLARRGAMLDEALEILAGLWSGERFRFVGTHFRVDEARFRPTPLQAPRIPVWIAAYWPHRRPLRRAARWDGMFALFPDGPPRDAEQLAEAAARARGAPAGLRPLRRGPRRPPRRRPVRLRARRGHLVARPAEPRPVRRRLGLLAGGAHARVHLCGAASGLSAARWRVARS